MAGGWARDDAVNDQIEVSTQEAIERMRLRAVGRGLRESATECDECGEPIPEPRRVALPGVRLCLDCASEQDKRRAPAGGINRRGSKDSQLK